MSVVLARLRFAGRLSYNSDIPVVSVWRCRVSPIDAATWPNVRDAAQQLNVSAVYTNRLIHTGRLQAVRTRLGVLIAPESVAAFTAERSPRRAHRAKEPMPV